MRRADQKRRITSFLNLFSYGNEKLLCYSIKTALKLANELHKVIQTR